jgi:hypothetical protein
MGNGESSTPLILLVVSSEQLVTAHWSLLKFPL